MTNDLNRIGRGRQGFQPDFVIGLVLGEDAKAYYYDDAIDMGAINDVLGETPVVVWASGEIYNAYIRQVDGQTLTFRADEGDLLIDIETGTVWDVVRGLAISGPLEGSSLRAVPSLSSFDWAWDDFYPDSEIYSP